MSGDNNLPHKVVMRLSEQMCKIGQGLTCTWQLKFTIVLLGCATMELWYFR